MKTAREYRREAKAALRGQWTHAIAFALIFGWLFFVSMLIPLGALIFPGALIVGYAFMTCQLYRRGSLALGDLFQGFRVRNLKSTIGLYLKTILFTLFWSLLFYIPGIIAAYRYSMAPYILADHPEMTGGEAIKASKRLMKGKKWKLFCLHLSFLGWWILCVLTCGILVIWVAPWMDAAQAAFYESVKDEVTRG